MNSANPVPSTDLTPPTDPSPPPSAGPFGLSLAPPVNRWADIDNLGDRIAELSAHIQVATYRLLVLIREFDQRDGWHIQGAKSCAHWLNWRIGLDIGAAREKVRVARALEELPTISRAMSKGEVSYSKVRAMTRVATPKNETALMELARAGTTAHVERVVRAWRRVDRLAENLESQKQREHRYLRTYTDEDGMLVLRGRLAPEVGAAVLRALEAAGDELFRARKPGETQPASGQIIDDPTVGQRRADALALVAEKSLALGAGGSTGEVDVDGSMAEDVAGGPAKAGDVRGVHRSPRGGSSGDRYQVVVHVEAEALVKGSETGQALLEDGVRVSAETSRRIACEASKVVMRHGPGGGVLDVGRKTRTIPPAIRRALRYRDRGCRFPGCGVRVCDAHHVEHWADGGKTKLDNLLLLCRRHHTAVHEDGYRVRLCREGTARFYDPRGQRIFDVPPAPRIAPGAVERMQRDHAAEGVEIGPLTGLPTWDGTRLDLGLALGGLMSIGRAGTA